MPSFDIVSKIDMPSVQNALDGVRKEINTRYDFKGSICEVEHQDDKIIIKADDELKRKQVEELLVTHLTRKKVDSGALEFGKAEAASGNSIRQEVIIKQGVDTFFGVQGGACARLIECVIKFKVLLKQTIST